MPTLVPATGPVRMRLQHEIDAALTIIIQLAQDAAQKYKTLVGVNNETGWDMLRRFDDMANQAEALAEELEKDRAAAPKLHETLTDLVAALAAAGLDTMPGDTMADVRAAVDDARAAIAKQEE